MLGAVLFSPELSTDLFPLNFISLFYIVYSCKLLFKINSNKSMAFIETQSLDRKEIRRHSLLSCIIAISLPTIISSFAILTPLRSHIQELQGNLLYPEIALTDQSFVKFLSLHFICLFPCVFYASLRANSLQGRYNYAIIPSLCYFILNSNLGSSFSSITMIFIVIIFIGKDLQIIREI